MVLIFLFNHSALVIFSLASPGLTDKDVKYLTGMLTNRNLTTLITLVILLEGLAQSESAIESSNILGMILNCVLL
jgi:hypothetical protein